MDRRGHLVCLLTVMLLFLPEYSQAGVDEEIIHLLSFVEKSQCTYVRNGKEHDSADARQHIERKYNHVKSYVRTTEQFIHFAATKSSISGKPYMVKCNGKIMQSSVWLNEELERHRSR